MPQSIRESLRGCYEITLFLKQGLDRFDNTRAAFVKSLLIVLLMIPLQIPFTGIDTELSQYNLTGRVVIIAYRDIISTAFFLGGVWAASWPLERKDLFYRFGTAVNWLNIIVFLLLLPYYLLIINGVFTADQLGNFLLFLLGFFIAIIAFTARHGLNVNWAIAIVIALSYFACAELAAIMLGGPQIAAS